MLASPRLQIAVLGAGKIGSTFAFQSARVGGLDVTVIARRGSVRLQQLERDQAIIDVKGRRLSVNPSVGHVSILLKELSVCARPHKINLLTIKLIDQEKISADMALAMVRPFPFERMIEPFGAKQRIISDQQHHRFLELAHIVTPGPDKLVPIFHETFCIGSCAGK